MLARANQKMTADQFLVEYSGIEGRYELVDGEVWAMAGGTMSHAAICGRIFNRLTDLAQSRGCQPFNSDMGLRVDERTIRYPDVAVYCDPRDLTRNPDTTLVLEHPTVVVEVLSPSTARDDRSTKVFEYKQIEAVQLVVLVDPATQTVETHARFGADEWRHVRHRAGADIDIDPLAARLTSAEIFGP